MLAVVLLGLFTLVSAYGTLIEPTPLGAVQVAVGIIFLILLPRGHPLARQWAIYLGVMTALASVLGFAASRGDQGIILMVAFVLSMLLIIALLQKPAKHFFCLRCQCGSYAVRAADLLYNKIRCRKCDRRWTPRDYVRVDPSVFE